MRGIQPRSDTETHQLSRSSRLTPLLSLRQRNRIRRTGVEEGASTTGISSRSPSGDRVTETSPDRAQLPPVYSRGNQPFSSSTAALSGWRKRLTKLSTILSQSFL